MPNEATEQPWTHLIYVEVNCLLNRADLARRHGKPQAAAALELCAKAAKAAAKELTHAE